MLIIRDEGRQAMDEGILFLRWMLPQVRANENS